MRLPIQYALFYPQRFPNEMIPRLDTGISHALTFQPLEKERFPCFGLAVAAGRKGGTYPAVVSAADEVAVQAFLDGKIPFTGIYKAVDKVLSEHESTGDVDAEKVLAADRWATDRAQRNYRFLNSQSGFCMETVLISIGAMVPMLLILVVVHELGHYFTARSLGVKVLEFGVGFPPRAFGFYTGKTRVAISPYTQFVNMDGPAELSRGRFVKVTSSEDSEGNLVPVSLRLLRPLQG